MAAVLIPTILVRLCNGSRGRRGVGQFATLLPQIPARPAPQGFQPSVALRFGSTKVGARVRSYAAPRIANGVGAPGRSDVQRDSPRARASPVGDASSACARKYVQAHSGGGFGLPGGRREDSVRRWEQPCRDSSASNCQRDNPSALEGSDSDAHSASAHERQDLFGPARHNTARLYFYPARLCRSAFLRPSRCQAAGYRHLPRRAGSSTHAQDRAGEVLTWFSRPRFLPVPCSSSSWLAPQVYFWAHLRGTRTPVSRVLSSAIFRAAFCNAKAS